MYSVDNCLKCTNLSLVYNFIWVFEHVGYETKFGQENLSVYGVGDHN